MRIPGRALARLANVVLYEGLDHAPYRKETDRMAAQDGEGALGFVRHQVPVLASIRRTNLIPPSPARRQGWLLVPLVTNPRYCTQSQANGRHHSPMLASSRPVEASHARLWLHLAAGSNQ